MFLQLLQVEKREQRHIAEVHMKSLLCQNFVCPLNQKWKNVSWNLSVLYNPNTGQTFKSARDDILTSICGRLADCNGCKLEKALNS